MIKIILFVVFIMIIELLAVLWYRYITRLGRESRKIKMEINCEKEYQKQTQNAVDSIRKYRHDLANHIQVMEHLKRKDAALPIIILTMKEQECLENHISYHYDVAEDLEFPLSPQDTTSLLTNLLDNAIEANEKICKEEERNINISIERQNNHYLIHLRNALEQVENFTFDTQKKDKEWHGYGTKIIDDILKENNGNIRYQLKGKLMDITVELGEERMVEATCRY